MFSRDVAVSWRGWWFYLTFLSNPCCRYSGIPCITVVGYAKGIEFRPGMQFQDRRLNHSWNVIFVDDAWQLVDSHWATRYELILFTHRQSVLVLDQNVNRSVIGSQHSCVLYCSWPKILHIPSSFPSFFQACDWRAKKRATRFFFANGQIYFFEKSLKILCYILGISH